MGWWRLRLTAKNLAFLRLTVSFFPLRLTEKLKINFLCFKKLRGPPRKNQTKMNFFRQGSKIEILSMFAYK